MTTCVDEKWIDPCARAAFLTNLYYERVASGNVKMVRTKSMDNEREAQWYNSDMSLLRLERDKAIDECRALNGQPPVRRRFAIQAGSRRVPRLLPTRGPRTY